LSSIISGLNVGIPIFSLSCLPMSVPYLWFLVLNVRSPISFWFFKSCFCLHRFLFSIYICISGYF
jgi:hypothetical protein